jgi:hypothetical protein
MFFAVGVLLATLIAEADSANRTQKFAVFAVIFLITPIWMFLTSFLLAWVLKIFPAGKSALYALVLTILRFSVLGIFGLIIYLI